LNAYAAIKNLLNSLLLFAVQYRKNALWCVSQPDGDAKTAAVPPKAFSDLEEHFILGSTIVNPEMLAGKLAIALFVPTQKSSYLNSGGGWKGFAVSPYSTIDPGTYQR